MLYVVLGTTGRDYLKDHNLIPEIQLRWDCGVDLIKLLLKKESGNLVEHPSCPVGEVVQAYQTVLSLRSITEPIHH